MKYDLDEIRLGIFFFDSSRPVSKYPLYILVSEFFIDTMAEEEIIDWDNNPICL